MSVSGIEQEIRWVKDKVKNLNSEVSEIDNIDLVSAFEELESTVADLIDECEDTISSIQDL